MFEFDFSLIDDYYNGLIEKIEAFNNEFSLDQKIEDVINLFNSDSLF